MTHSPSQRSSRSGRPDGGLYGLITFGLRHRAILFWVTVGFGVVSYAVEKLNPTWSVEATILPQGSNDLASRLSGLGAQIGITLPAAQIGDPVQFYAELLQSREVLDDVVVLPFTVATHRGSADSLHGSFLDFYGIKGADSADRVWRGREKLKGLLSITTDHEAGFVEMRLLTKWPDLSLQLGRQILTLTNEVGNSKQRSKAMEERVFIEARMRDAQAALGAAEGDLQQFLTQNRQYQNSPLLVLDYAQLQRRVDLRQQVFVSLAQAFEQSKIDEVRDTPVFMIVDGVDGSLRPGRRALRDAVVWMLIGGSFAFLVLLGFDALEQFREGHPESVESTLADLRNTWPLRWLRRRPR